MTRFAIENRLGYGRLHLGHGKYVWRSFTATTEAEDITGLHVELDIEVDGAGLPHCKGFRLAASPQEWDDDRWIDTALVRKLNPSTLIDEAFGEAIESLAERELESGEVVLELDRTEAARHLDAMLRRVLGSKRRKPMSTDELRALAAFYKTLAARGQLPTAALVEHYNVDPTTVRGWWRKCEKAGLLRPEERLDQAAGGRRSRRAA